MLALGYETCLLYILVGHVRELVDNGEEDLCHGLELHMRHGGHFAESFDHGSFIGVDSAGIFTHFFFSLGFIAHLADQPVGNVPAANVYSGASIPQAAAHAGLDDGSFGMKTADRRIGLEAVGLPLFSFANNVLT